MTKYNLISRIDHVSIAVKDYDKALYFFKNILGAIPGAFAKDDNMKYFWQIFSIGDLSRIELLNPTDKGSFLDNFLKDKKDGGVHHITFETQDIREAIKILEKNNIPYFGFNEIGDIWKEIFIHPKHAFGVLIQIAEFSPNDWLSGLVKLDNGKKWSIEKNGKGYKLTLAHPGGGKAEIELTKEEIKQLVCDLETCTSQ